jgi:hypothetical protein
MRLWREIKGFIWWTYERGSVRYDIMVGLIVAFILLAPRAWFDDRPPEPQTHQIVALPGGAFRLDARLLSSETNNVEDTAERILKARTGKKVRVVRWEVQSGADGQAEAYHVWIEP